MREFKFRAWDKETKEMSYDFLSENWLRVCIESPHIELMLYTWLKDKNGNDIYEGDLCKKDDVVYEVRWVEDCSKFGVKVIKSDSVLIRGCTFPIHQYVKVGTLECILEVIGNIYESRETRLNIQLFNVEKGKDIVCPNCKNSLIPFDGSMPVPIFQEIIHCSCGHDVSAILRSQAKGGEEHEQGM